jgi:hypothetical protein
VGCECDCKFCYLKITHISIALLLPDAIGVLLLLVKVSLLCPRSITVRTMSLLDTQTIFLCMSRQVVTILDWLN